MLVEGAERGQRSLQQPSDLAISRISTEQKDHRPGDGDALLVEPADLSDLGQRANRQYQHADAPRRRSRTPAVERQEVVHDARGVGRA